MTRITTEPDNPDVPSIDRQSVANFFKQRAEKVSRLGHIQAVIYQDKNPELARLRDAAEKAKLLPMLHLQGNETLLDMGCGTGRWADVVVPLCGRYIGIDFSQELIEIAVKRFESIEHAHFVCMPAEKVSSNSLTDRFQRILSCGLFIYLNDDELINTIRGYAQVADKSCKILLREPISSTARLTIKEHFSEDMDQVYNAIYRNEVEIISMLQNVLIREGFRLTGLGDVYEPVLNNRSETKQRWFLLER